MEVLKPIRFLTPRVVAYLFILGGVTGFWDAIEDQRRGVATAVSPGGSFVINTARRDHQPELFKGLMAYQWYRAAGWLVAGVVILGLCRKADRIDPFSRRFKGKGALDDCERTLDAELEKKYRPLR